MGFFVFLFFTAFWAGVGGVLPFFLPTILPSNDHQQLIKVVLMTSSFACYSMWLITYMAQANPLFGPEIVNTTHLLMKKEW